MSDDTIRTIIVSTTPLAHEGVRTRLVNSRFEIIPQGNTSDILHLARISKEAHLIITIIEAPSHLKTVSGCRWANPDAKLVLICQAHMLRLIPTETAIAVHAILDCSLEKASFVSALNLVMSGVCVHSPIAVDCLASTSSASKEPAIVDRTEPGGEPLTNFEDGYTQIGNVKLTNRELAVLRHLTDGASNKDIARRCNITEPTVKIYVKNLLRKLSMRNRTQAAIWACQNGMRFV